MRFSRISYHFLVQERPCRHASCPKDGQTHGHLCRCWNLTKFEFMSEIVDGKMAVNFLTKFELLVRSVLEKRDKSCVINRFRILLDCYGVYLPCTQVVADCISDMMKLGPRECSIKLLSWAFWNLKYDVIFTCASLIDLQLWAFRTFIAIEPNSINLPCLKTLNLAGCASDDFVKKLLLGCPVLEELVISCSMGIIEICSNTLKKLVIRDWYKGNRLQISTPNLLYFEISNREIMDMGQILLLNMPSLVDVFISIPIWYNEDDYITGVPKFIASFPNLEILKLEFDCIDEKALNKEFSNYPIFNSLKHVELVSFGFNVFDLAPFFLHRSPKLQDLTLQNIYSRATAPERRSDALVQRAWATGPEGPSDALVQRELLKTVRIVRFKNDNGFVDQLINMLSAHVKIIGEIMRV